MADTLADLVQDMTTAGVAGAFIIRMLDLYREAQRKILALEDMRKSNRERQQKCRTRKAVTSRHVTLRDNQLSFLLPLNTSQSSPLKEESKNGESFYEAASVRARGQTLPRDWMPAIDDYQYGMQLGLTRQEIDGMAEDMRFWAGANRNRAVARKADWNLTFKGWLRREAGKRTSRNGGGGTAFDVSSDLENLIEEGGVPDEPITRGAGAIRRG